MEREMHVMCQRRKLIKFCNKLTNRLIEIINLHYFHERLIKMAYA